MLSASISIAVLFINFEKKRVNSHLNIFDFVEKPFNDQLLLDCVQRAIESDRQQRQSDAQLDEWRERMATLTPREEKVLRMRFGIGEKADHTLEEVGQDFAVTRERIRQIEAKALRKLRHPTRSRKLKSFIDY